jgi:hypothetical protein
MNPRARSIFDGTPGNIEISRIGGPGQHRQHRSLYLLGYPFRNRVLFFRSCGKSDVENIHLQTRKLLGNSKLFFDR